MVLKGKNNMILKSGFTKEDSQIVKGFAIVMMLFHHLFYSREAFEGLDIKFILLSEENTILLASLCKICVAVFVFISAYGLTIKMKNNYEDIKGMLVRRLIRILIPFIFVYALSLIFCILKDFSYVRNTYGSGWRFGVWAMVDSLGLANVFTTPTLNETWWYMGLAVCLVIFVPSIYLIYTKIGVIVLLMPLFLTWFVGIEPKYLNWYLLTILFGIFFADRNLFEKYSREKHRIAKIFIYLGLLVVTGIIRSTLGFVNILDGLMAVIIVMFVRDIVSAIWGIKTALFYIGKYSFTIFLIHTFIYKYFFRDFTYSFSYPVLILGVLLVISLIIAIIIEKLKSICRIDQMSNIIMKKYEKMFD